MKSFFRIVLILALIGICCAQIGGHRPGGGWSKKKLRNEGVSLVKRAESETSLSEEEEEESLHYAYFGILHGDDEANYDFISASYEVPPYPTNKTESLVVDYSIFLRNPGKAEIEDNADSMGLSFWYSEEEWKMAVCTCLENCTCSNSSVVTPGEKINFLFSLQNGTYSLSGTSSSGSNVQQTELAEKFQGSFGTIGVQFTHNGADNCNDLPSSNSFLVSDLILKDGGEEIDNIDWAYSYSSSSFCSEQFAANDLTVSFSWNSNNWTGNRQTCAFASLQSAVNSWKENEIEKTHFTVQLQNLAFSETADLTSFSFTLNPAPIEIWGVEMNSDGSYSIPSYSLPLISFNDTFDFGYIGSKRAAIEGRECEGGEKQFVGDEEGKPVSGSVLDSHSHEGCSVSFSQTTISLWEEGENKFSHVNVVVSNDGDRVVKSLKFTASDASLISQSWGIEREEEIFSSPSYLPSLSVGSSFSFGYIVKSDSPIDFSASELTCN